MIITFVILLSSIAGICVALMDRIAHYNNLEHLGYFFSMGAYHNAKYKFIAKHPKVPKWFVLNFLVMFLDGWHLLKVVALLCFFGMIALFSWIFALVGICLYQFYFIIFYTK